MLTAELFTTADYSFMNEWAKNGFIHKTEYFAASKEKETLSHATT